MKPYAVLIRGINVGGKNMIPMAGLKSCLEALGFAKVSTFIASGNAFLSSDKSAKEVAARVEKALPEAFKLDSELVKVLVLTREQLQTIVDQKPEGFGDEPGKYHSDVIFLMGVDPVQAMAAFDPREGVDTIWPGDGVIYFRRLSALRTKSRLSKIMGTPLYQSMTIRTWNTANKLLEIIRR